jgi:hypothetical protein
MCNRLHWLWECVNIIITDGINLVRCTAQCPGGMGPVVFLRRSILYQIVEPVRNARWSSILILTSRD